MVLFVATVTPRNKEQSLHHSIKIIMIIANCLGLLPVNGVVISSPKDLHFRWFSLKTCYSVSVLSMLFFQIILQIFQDISLQTLCT